VKTDLRSPPEALTAVPSTQLAEALADALRTGLSPGLSLEHRADPPSPDAADRVVRDPFADFPEACLDEIRRCRGLRSEALQTAVAGDLDSAARLLASADRASAAVDLPRAARLREIAHHAGVASYIAYRSGDRDLAEAILDQGSEADAEAAVRYGAVDAEGHRIRLATNRLRVRCRSNEHAGAVTLAADILDRIAGDPDALPSRGLAPLDAAALRTLGLSLLELSAVEELVAVIGALQRERRHGLLAPIWHHLDGWGRGRRDRGHVYLEAVRARMQGDTDAFVERAAVVLGRGPSGSRIIWRALVAEIDAARAADLLGTSDLLEAALVDARAV
jgi:hypothetical protein